VAAAMKIAFISDIHSNYEALRAAADYIKNDGIEKVYCAGDIAGYGAQPDECIEALIAMKALCVKGNHEDYLLGSESIGNASKNAKESILWQKTVVKESSIKYLRGLNVTETLKEHSIFLTHGSPYQPEMFHYIQTPSEIMEAFAAFDEQICIIGHSHVPAAFRLDKESVLHEYKLGSTVHVENGYRYIVNVGSVGQPRDGIPKACVYIYDTDKAVFNGKSLDYDIHTAEKKIIQAGLPSTLAYRLAFGF